MFNEDDADFVALLQQHHFEGQTDILATEKSDRDSHDMPLVRGLLSERNTLLLAT